MKKEKLRPLDRSQRLSEADFERKRPYVLEYIKKTFKPSKKEWLLCYGVKQKPNMTIGYFFERDMAKYFELAGYEIRLTQQWGYEVKADYRRPLDRSYDGKRPIFYDYEEAGARPDLDDLREKEAAL
jgi:hypothetical protein